MTIMSYTQKSMEVVTHYPRRRYRLMKLSFSFKKHLPFKNSNQTNKTQQFHCVHRFGLMNRATLTDTLIFTQNDATAEVVIWNSSVRSN